jgi:hypothetical protein
MANRTTQIIERDRVISGLVDDNCELINDVLRLQDALLEAQRTNVVLREMITELLDRPIAPATSFNGVWPWLEERKQLK